MACKIALFNHKGGVSKTTTTFHLGWMLAKKGKTVILADADPQCNLTGLVLGNRSNEFEHWYESEGDRNFKAGLAPAFEPLPWTMEPVKCHPVPKQEGLFLLPGHIDLSEYEIALRIAQELSGSIQTLANLPGAPSYLLDKTAEAHKADYVLVDMNASLSALNQNLLMPSQYFIIPTTPDYFSVMAINSLSNILPRWREWSRRAGTLPTLKNAVYPFPVSSPRFLGTVIKNPRQQRGSLTRVLQNWTNRVNETTANRLVPQLKKHEMMLPAESYNEAGTTTYRLATIPDSNDLVARSQEHRTPAFELDEDQIGLTGPALAKAVQSRELSRRIFSDLADKVITLTTDAGSK